MFDINNIINTAIAEAVNARITEVLAQHANTVGGLTERIDTLEKNEEALVRRIAALEGDVSHTVQVQQANITAALAEKIVALENNPAGTPATITADAFVTHLDNQEWFWEKLTRKAHEAAEAAVEEAMDSHCSDYDHDEYDNHINDDDKHFDGDIEDAVRDALSNMTFDVSIR